MESLYQYQNQLIASTEFSFRRSLLDKIDWEERLIGIIGARGVGKTTCLLQYLSGYTPGDRSVLYVTLDNIANPYPTLFALAEDFYRQGGERLVIDEIHKYPNWAAEIKNLYDLYPRLKIVFSGSSVLKLMDAHTDLSRRSVIHHLHGLSFREFIGIRTGKPFPVVALGDIVAEHEAISLSISREIRPLPLFSDYLKFGYYPYFLQSEASYSFKLEATLNFILENEIPAMFSLEYRNVQKMKRALRYIAGNLPYQPNISKLSEAVELNRNTLLQYLSFLEKADVITALYPAGSFYGKLTKPGKILLHHPNIVFTLSPGSVSTGNLRECLFVNQVQTVASVELAPKGDFLVQEKFLFEVGGKGKSNKQLAGKIDSFLVLDDIEHGTKSRIPLWLFGFLY
ncbi:MAG: ATP-binding protein [Bacteroidetes bacterium]|nr:ATP-binding protein [Bacteroidota bacterium]